jgi:hypothetical protein
MEESMIFVYLSPHFPPNYYLFSKNLHDLGIAVLGLADEPYDLLRYELRQSLTEYFRVPDLHNYDQLIRALGYYTHRYGKIDRLDSLNEYWLETEAKLRTDFNIEGIKIDQINKIKRKSEMKKLFTKAGVNTVPGIVVHKAKQAVQFISQYGFPVVAKPDIGVGAAKTYKITNQAELNKFLNEKMGAQYFMESFVDGKIQTFDGLTDRDGQIVFFTSHEYSQGIMEAVNNDDDIYYYSLREIPPDLEAAGRATVTAFNVRERFFHFEFFRTMDDQLIGLEVNIRPPGGLTTDMFNYANDIDVYREWANIIANHKFSADYSRPYHCCYVGRKANKPYMHTHEDIINQYGPAIVHHEKISDVFSIALGNFGYLVRSPSLEEVIEIASYIQEKA